MHKALWLLMKEHRYSVTSLADKVAMKQSTLWTKINKKTEFTVSEAVKIANVLGIKCAEIEKYFVD